MEVKKIFPPVSPFLYIKLDKKIIDYLWNVIEIAQNNNKTNKHNLIGNISKSLLLKDIDSLFFKSVCIPLIKIYRESNPSNNDPVEQNVLLDPTSNIVLDSWWLNYQYKTEFNPYHDHSGVYSFAIWMKIPYSWEDQKKLIQFNDIKEQNRKAGNFEFEYLDTLGGIKNFTLNLSPEYEGSMAFFPAKLRHCVYPFYEIDEPRISIAGNLAYLPA